MQKGSSSSVRVFYPRFDKKGLIEELKKRLDGLQKKLPLSLVVLFGSYAKGNYTVASDIDLLVVYKDRVRKDAFAMVKKVLNIPLLEPHVYSEDEYKGLKEVINRMIASGVVLFSRDEAAAKD